MCRPSQGPAGRGPPSASRHGTRKPIEARRSAISSCARGADRRSGVPIHAQPLTQQHNRIQQIIVMDEPPLAEVVAGVECPVAVAAAALGSEPRISGSASNRRGRSRRPRPTLSDSRALWLTDPLGLTAGLLSGCLLASFASALSASGSSPASTLVQSVGQVKVARGVSYVISASRVRIRTRQLTED